MAGFIRRILGGDEDARRWRKHRALLRESVFERLKGGMPLRPGLPEGPYGRYQAILNAAPWESDLPRLVRYLISQPPELAADLVLK